ncbi:type II toxin-antitoxin system prevent-host-death family antitoxin [Thermomonas fusca]|uniref:Antitoxin n=1 Tax=Thermomonas fusca TaxID=215690 RepID=A0A5R9PIP1_9GAMM|nr:type II toxin-antitoxin system prevent-host-death family antitoxin [Thermomonas fusca]TLX22470.1 type II toxin-antitoxin system Phd/YefM family antitoxin [Thermomonas fusca]
MAATILKPMDDLPHTPASDVKKLGWRGVMQVVARNGRMVVTNHNKPEAVILPVEEYNRLLALLREAGEKDRLLLEDLRRRFDERLACLDAPGAGDTLRGILRKPLKLEGRVIAGETC